MPSLVSLIVYHLLAVWNVTFADSKPLDLLLFDDSVGDDLSTSMSTSDLFWLQSAESSLISSSGEDSLRYPPPSEDGRDGALILADSSGSCKHRRSMPENNYDDNGLHARDGSSSLCLPELDLPLDAISNPEAWLRNNVLFNPLLPLEQIAPNENSEPLLLPDRSESEKVRKTASEGDEGSPCAFPYIWHLCCDFEFGCRPSIYFGNERVTDCMSGCHLCTFHSGYMKT